MFKKTDFNAKVTKIEGKIPSISVLATSSALAAVENEISDVSSLVKKTDYNTKISEILNKANDPNHDKYVTTSEFNTMAADVFKARLAAQTDLIKNSDFDFRLKKISDRVTKNKTKHLLVENELKKLPKVEEDGTQNYFVFQPIYKYFKRIASAGNYIHFWKSKGLSDEKLDFITASNYKITSKLSFYCSKAKVEFNGSCLKQDKVTYNYGTIVNIYIVYEIDQNCSISSYPTLENCHFGAVTLTKRIDIDKYKFSGFGIGFDRHGEFSFGNGLGRNYIFFGAGFSSYSHDNNKKIIFSYKE